MERIWKIKNTDPQLQVKLSEELNIHPVVAQLLINRGIVNPKEAKFFLNAQLSDFHDPFLFKDMRKAVLRIQQAKQNAEIVLVFGDYDVDGVTSSTLLTNLLKSMGIKVFNFIPHRMEHGYGLHIDVAAFAKQNGVTLLISVDCGTTAFEEVKAINAQGIEVIVIDHHEPMEHRVPDAFAIINPKQKDCPYPFKELASVGLVVKLYQAFHGVLNEDILDLAAIGTIADIVPLRDENRIIVKAGLLAVGKTKNVGLKALLDVAKIKDKKISPYHVGFILGPRINAAGRMDSAHKSLDLFLSEDSEEAYNLARILEKHNTQRQKTQNDIVQEALGIVETEIDFENEKVIVLSKEGWHKGVLGIVASRLTDKYYRPSIVISLKDGVGTASARSIDGFHLHEVLSNCADHLEEFGGHEGAAGLTIKAENIDPFRQLINKIAHNTLELQKLRPCVDIDCEIPLSLISLKLANTIDSMEPFGEGNPHPTFCSRRLLVKTQAQVLGKDTLKFWVTDGKKSISAVGFGMGKLKDMVNAGAQVDLAYQIQIDDWNKAPTPQLKIKDIKVSE